MGTSKQIRMIYDYQGTYDFVAPSGSWSAPYGAASGWYEFDPVPLMTLVDSYNQSISGSGISRTIQVTLNGTLVESKGLNNLGDQALPNLRRLDHQIDQMREALSHPSGLFWIQVDNYPIFSGIPRIQSVSFNSGIWYNVVDYQVSMIIQQSLNDDNIKQYSDTWSFSQNDNETIEITHSASAVGVNAKNDPGTAFQNARNFVVGTLASSNPLAQAYIINTVGYAAYKHGRTETKDQQNGEYSIQETWVAVSGVPYIDQWTTDLSWSTTDQTISVTVDGTVTGYDLDLINFDYNSAASASGAANTGFNDIKGEIYDRANYLASKYGVVLNQTVRTYAYSENPKQGIITYSYSYDDRPSTPSGVTNQTISIDYQGGDPIVAIIPIPGRGIGPIFQDMQTRGQFTKTVNIDWQLQRTQNAELKPNSVILTQSQADLLMRDRFLLYRPSGVHGRFAGQTKNYDPLSRRLRRSVSWTYTRDESDDGFRFDI